MTAHAAVGVDDDLTTGQTTVTFRSTNDEKTGRVDVILGVFSEKIGWKRLLDEFFLQDLTNLSRRDLSRVHRGNNHGGDAVWLAIDILDGNLSLGVRAEPGLGTILA